MTLIDPNAEAYYIGLMNAAGYRDKDLKKPTIGIVNSWNDVNPGHKPRRLNLRSPLPATAWPS